MKYKARNCFIKHVQQSHGIFENVRVEEKATWKNVRRKANEGNDFQTINL